MSAQFPMSSPFTSPSLSVLSPLCLLGTGQPHLHFFSISASARKQKRCESLKGREKIVRLRSFA